MFCNNALKDLVLTGTFHFCNYWPSSHHLFQLYWHPSSLLECTSTCIICLTLIVFFLREDGELEDGEIDDEGIGIEEEKEIKVEPEVLEKDREKEKVREKDDKSHRHTHKRHRKIKEKHKSKRRRRDRQKVYSPLSPLKCIT